MTSSNQLNGQDFVQFSEHVLIYMVLILDAMEVQMRENRNTDWEANVERVGVSLEGDSEI